MVLLRAIIFLVLISCLVFFGVLNTVIVDFVWSPFHEAARLPLFAVCCSAMCFGFLFGGFVVWLNGLRSRREGRTAKRDLRKLEKKLEEIEDEEIS